MHTLGRLVGWALLIAATSSTALAQPPASCARKFVGTWSWSSSTGIHNIAHFNADGTSSCSGNPFCHQGSYTWTCSGNQLTSHGAVTTVLTLSPDGRTMTGMGGIPPNLQTVVRIGKAEPAVVASDTAKLRATPQPSKAQPAAVPAPSPVPTQSGSCSDITGLGPSGSAPTNCSTGSASPTAAQRANESKPIIQPPARAPTTGSASAAPPNKDQETLAAMTQILDGLYAPEPQPSPPPAQTASAAPPPSEAKQPPSEKPGCNPDHGFVSPSDEGEAFMYAAKKIAENQTCEYWRIAATTYWKAHHWFDCADDKGQKDLAGQLAVRFDDGADEAERKNLCKRYADLSGAPTPSPGGTPGKDDRCQQALQQLTKVADADVSKKQEQTQEFEKAVEAMGCKVPGPRECVSARLKGTPIPPGCSTKQVNMNSISPDASDDP
jgi:hypothetical protein